MTDSMQKNKNHVRAEMAMVCMSSHSFFGDIHLCDAGSIYALHDKK